MPRPVDPLAATHGLPPSMRIAIAAKTLGGIERHVGPIVRTYGRMRNGVGAVLIDTPERPDKDGAKIWDDPRNDAFMCRLFPLLQVWVHVDYARYRAAYIRLGMPPIPPGHVLDHIQNQRAIRLSDNSHPYLRLCPVSKRVNTSSGINVGAEGMERTHVLSARQGNILARQAIERANLQEVIYADPLDLTKMLKIVPGTQTLNGVRDTLRLFYE